MRYPGPDRSITESDMAAYKHGEMDIASHEQTFAGFIKFVTRAIIVIVALVILMALLNA
jgi:fumarate reductase subunit C